MRSAIRVGLCAAITFALAATSAPAVAKLPPITGKLSARGYTVLALAPDGSGRAVWARGRRFRLHPPAGAVTLQLRAPDGKYAGPIVVGRRAGHAIIGVRAGAKLGQVKIDARRGYAKLARALPRRRLDPSRLARALRGVPFGARNYGFVRSRRINGAAAASRGPGGDRDSDGVPDALDVAAAGDLVFNHFKRSRRVRAAQAGGAPFVLGGMGLGNDGLHETVNANALPALTAEQLAGLMDATLVRMGALDVNRSDVVDPTEPGFALELDCRGKIYCAPHSQGGTGQLFDGENERLVDFPDCCDPEPGNGLGAFAGRGALVDYNLLVPGATTAQIGSGDELIWRLTKVPRGFWLAPGDYPTVLQFVFASTPALVSYSDTAGHSATVGYPVAAPTPNCPPPSCPPGGPGTQGNGFPVSAGPDGQIKVSLTYWRPQRAPIAPNPDTRLGGDACFPDCRWVDIGRLIYKSVIVGGGGCPESSLSTVDPNLAVSSEGRPAGNNPGLVVDSSPDRAADAQNTFTYTVNLSDCLPQLQTGAGPPPKPLAWNRGEELQFSLQGLTGLSDPADTTNQRVAFRLE